MQLSLRRHALPGLELVVVLGVAVLGSYFVSQRYCVASPVVLLGAGFLLGFIPVLRRVSLPPEVVLFLFLPAAIAPTDATAVGVLAKALPCRSVTILSAESLANDGTALVIYALAVGITAGEEHPSVLRRSTRCGSHRQRGGTLAFPGVARRETSGAEHRDQDGRDGKMQHGSFTAFSLARLCTARPAALLPRLTGTPAGLGHRTGSRETLARRLRAAPATHPTARRPVSAAGP